MARRTAGTRWLIMGIVVMAVARADLAVPPNVDFELVSPTENYRFFVDLDQSSQDYYPGAKAIFDVAGSL